MKDIEEGQQAPLPALLHKVPLIGGAFEPAQLFSRDKDNNLIAPPMPLKTQKLKGEVEMQPATKRKTEAQAALAEHKASGAGGFEDDLKNLTLAARQQYVAARQRGENITFKDAIDAAHKEYVSRVGETKESPAEKGRKEKAGASRSDLKEAIKTQRYWQTELNKRVHDGSGPGDDDYDEALQELATAATATNEARASAKALLPGSQHEPASYATTTPVESTGTLTKGGEPVEPTPGPGPSGEPAVIPTPVPTAEMGTLQVGKYKVSTPKKKS
jgi:hypothetical protein